MPFPMTGSERRSLHYIACELHERYAGTFGTATIERLLVDSFEQLTERATVRNPYRIVLVERFARERLAALDRASGQLDHGVPAVLFLCVHNAGRSQMALGWFTRLAGRRAIGWSAGSLPAALVNQAAVAAMAEVGIDISRGFPKPSTDEVLAAADVVVTMGCGDACPLLPGRRYEDWEVEDPAGLTPAQIRLVRDELGRRVADLLARLELATEHSALPGTPRPVARLHSVAPVDQNRISRCTL